MSAKYWAFISYNSHDRQIARWLHRKLETFRVPRDLVGETMPEGERRPARLYPVFRDRDELKVGPDLGEAIEAALDQSRYLIVICSPSAAKSSWVNEEVLIFQRAGRADHVFALIAAGEPHASQADDSSGGECFPPALRHVVSEGSDAAEVRADPIAADLRESGDGRNLALLKLIAAIIGVDFDKLRRREQHRRNRRLAIATTIALIVAALMTGLAVLAWRAQQEAVAQRTIAKKNETAAKVSEGKARHQLGLAFLEKAQRLEMERRQSEAALLSARALGLLSGERQYLRNDDPATQQAYQLVKNSRTLKPLWRSDYRGPSVSSQLGFATDGHLLLKPGRRVGWWNPKTGVTTKAPVNIPDEDVNSGALSELGDKLALVFDRAPGVVIDLESGVTTSLLAALPKPMNSSRGIALSPDGDLLAVAAKKDTLIYRIDQEQVSTALPDLLPGSVYEVRFSPSGRLLAVNGAGDRSRFGLWDTVTGNWVHLQKGVSAFAFLASGSVIYAEGEQVFELPYDGGEPKERFRAERTVSALATIPDSDEILLAKLRGALQRRSWPDGAVLASTEPTSDWIKTIHVSRDGVLVTANEVYRLPGLEPAGSDSSGPFLGGESSNIAWSPDGKHFATDGYKGLRIWNRAGQPVKGWAVDKITYDVAYSPDGELIVVCGSDGVRIWRHETGEMVYDDGDDWTCYSVAFSPEGTRLGAARMSGVDVIDLETFKRLRTITRPYEEYEGDDLRSIAFIEGTNRIVGGDFSGNIEIINNESGELEVKLEGSLDSVNAIIAFGGGRYVAAAGGMLRRDSRIFIYDVIKEQRVLTLDNDTPVTALSVHPSQWLLASAHNDGSIRVWDLLAQRVMSVVPGYGPPALDVKFDPRGTLLASAGGIVALWDPSFLSPISTASSPISKSSAARDSRLALGDMIRGSRAGYGFDFVGDAGNVAIGNAQGMVHVIATDSGESVQSVTAHDGETSVVEADPQGELVATAGFDGAVHLWDRKLETRVRTLVEGNGGFISSIAFSPDGTRVAAGGERKFSVWNTHEGTVLLETAVDQWVNALVFHGEQLYIGTGDGLSGRGALMRWDGSPNAGLETLEVENSPITALDLDAGKLVIGHAGGTLETLDLNTDGHITRRPAGSAIRDLAWVGGGRLLTTDGQRISLWGRSGALIAYFDVGQVDCIRSHPKLDAVATETVGLVRIWRMPSPLALDLLESEGRFDGMEWRPELDLNLYGQPALYFEPAVQGAKLPGKSDDLH